LRLNAIWPEDRTQPARLGAPEALSAAQGIETRILQLSPRNDAQRWLQSETLRISSDILQTPLACLRKPRQLGPDAVPGSGGVLAYDYLR